MTCTTQIDGQIEVRSHIEKTAKYAKLANKW